MHFRTLDLSTRCTFGPWRGPICIFASDSNARGLPKPIPCHGVGLGCLAGRLVSFRDGTNRDLALGVVERAERGKIAIRTPLREGIPYAALAIGVAEAPGRPGSSA